jgi:hypothetical protein
LSFLFSNHEDGGGTKSSDDVDSVCCDRIELSKLQGGSVDIMVDTNKLWVQYKHKH